MQKNTLKQKLNANKPTFGPFIGYPTPQVVETIGWLGFDFIIVDCEHGIMDYETTENMIRAAELSGTTPIIRIGLNQQQHIQRYLEAGAQGVLIPLVNTGKQAQMVADSVKYPPMGKRGAFSGRSAKWGLQPIADYFKEANEETFVAVQIETREAVNNVDDITGTKNIDLIFFGPNDLALNYGYPGEPNHPKVAEIITELTKKVRAAGMHAGTLAGSGEQAKFWQERGVNWLVSSASRFLSQGAKDYLAEVKAATE